MVKLDLPLVTNQFNHNHMASPTGAVPEEAPPKQQQDKPDEQARRRRRRYSSGDRETWSRKVEYFFASLGYAVGLGNIWRFPYLCYRNGGGAFLIPYTLALIGVGFPILFLEMAFGQFASVGTITIWRVCPLFKGIGYTIVVVLMLVNTYYNVLIAYGLFYLFASITSELPWSKCDNKWNTKYCIIERKVFADGGSSSNSTLEMVNSTHVAYTAATAVTNMTTPMPTGEPFLRTLLRTPTEEFFERHLLHQSGGIETMGSVQWPLIICLVVSWFTCFMCLFKGIKSMGKAVIFTTIFSYIILTVLLIRGVTLPGSIDGIIYYLKPRFEKLGQLQVWGEASAQAFASLTLGGGGWITLSSYNKFKNNVGRDAVIVGFGNALTSFYGGFVIFSVLGYMAYIKGVPVDVVTRRGPGLAFIAYPEGLSLIPGAPFWSICFFFMMFTVGLDSLFGQVETIAAGIVDEYPDYLRPRRKLFTLFLCLTMFFFGIPLTTEGGIYAVTLMDWYTLLFSFSIISLFELIVIVYIYGYNRIAGDIELMIGHKPSIFYKVTWLGLTPVLLVCVIAFLSAYYVPAKYGDYDFPGWAESVGWAIALCPCLLIPLTAIVQVCRKIGGFSGFIAFFTSAEHRAEVRERLICPAMDWGPALPEIRRKFSYSAKLGYDDIEPVDLTGSPGEDDVFGPEGAELVDFKPRDPNAPEKEKLVKFQDDQPPQAAPPGDSAEAATERQHEREEQEPKV